MTDVNFPQDFYLDDVGVWRLKKEKLAELEKPKPMTNEEWIKQCTTEQLAEFLLHIADSCYWAGFFKGKDDDDSYDDEYCLINQNIVEWLKQPHTKGVEE